MTLQYFKTDRNGTKYYYDHTCPRCGGAGRSDNWWKTGYECYKCGGTGKRNTPKVVKVYTYEYQAKLNARRRSKAVENAPTEEDLADMKRRVDESRARAVAMFYESYGFDDNGHGWAYIGNTYRIKQDLREAGGKWIGFAQVLVCPVRIDVCNGVSVVELDISDKADLKNLCLGDAYRYLDNIR